MKSKAYICFIVCLILGSLLGGYSQKKYCQGGALLVPRHLYVMLYDSPNGNVVDSVINDTIGEFYPIFDVIEVSDSFIKVQKYLSAIDTVFKEGWIQLKYLGINPNTFSGFNLYASPNEGSAIIDSVPNSQWGDLYPILQCVDDWFYIKIYNAGQWREGWMSPEDQCDNPYSTCN